MMLELTKTDGLKVFIDPQSIESIEDQLVEFEFVNQESEKETKSAMCTLVTTGSGKEHIVMEHSTEVYFDCKHMMEQIADDNKVTLSLPGM